MTIDAVAVPDLDLGYAVAGWVRHVRTQPRSLLGSQSCKADARARNRHDRNGPTAADHAMCAFDIESANPAGEHTGEEIKDLSRATNEGRMRAIAAYRLRPKFSRRQPRQHLHLRRATSRQLVPDVFDLLEGRDSKCPAKCLKNKIVDLANRLSAPSRPPHRSSAGRFGWSSTSYQGRPLST